MVDLTVGYVSGIIAAGIYVLQFLIPTALTLILAGLLKDENSLATWTQIGRALHASHWPMLLRSDPASSRSVGRAVMMEGTLRPIIMLIVGIAAVVTPLGLYDAIIPGTVEVPQTFGYQKDTSSFGIGTPARSDLGFNRICGRGFRGLVPCPGASNTDIAIPTSLIETFQSGLKGMSSTVSSIFDIQWRSYAINRDPKKNNGANYLSGAFRQMDSVLLRDDYIVIEGLIVDNKNGGVGFRNHTVPSPLKYGGLWSEDLLFVEPSTKCVDTNITIDFSIPDSGANDTFDKVMITDRGGFSKLSHTYPVYDHDNPQKDPDLYNRAFKSAWLHNVFAMLLLNATNPRTSTMEPFSYLDSTEGKTFPIAVTGDLSQTQLGIFQDYILWNGVQLTPGYNSSTGGIGNKSKFPNPFGITKANYTTIKLLCKGAGSSDLANITNIGVGCGLIAGASRRSDGSTSLVTEPGSKWTIPIYSCASSTRAVIKTVDFRYNGTDGLKSLMVDRIQEKVHKVKPFWGVENYGFSLETAPALWGLVSEDYKGRENISVIQSDALWLPGFISTLGGGVGSSMNLPGVGFHTDAFAQIYGMTDGISSSKVLDYSGKYNLAMFAKWQTLSKNAHDSAKIVNQIWNDIVANAVVGTRSWTGGDNFGLQKRAENPPRGEKMVKVPVRVYNHQVRYRIAYGIPAFIACAITCAIAAAALVLCVCGRARPSVVRKYLHYTAAGRVIGTFMYPGQVNQQAPTKQWNDAMGSQKASLADLGPHAINTIGTNYPNTSKTNLDSPLLEGKENVAAAVHPIPVSPQQGYYNPNNPYQRA